MTIQRARPYLSLLLLAANASIACSSVPHTGRSQLSLVSDADMASMAERGFADIVKANSGRIVGAYDSPEAARTLALVRRVSERIVQASGLHDRLAWETIVVHANEANAFVLPNGKVVVFTGLLPIAATEAGLAAVMGHEVAHVAARHGAERASQQLATRATLATADIVGRIVGRSDPTLAPHGRVLGAALGLGAQYGVLLPYSRAHESEADRIGLTFAAKAGYDPAAAIGVWERLQARHGSGPWEFLSTHPDPSTRIATIRRFLPEARSHLWQRSNDGGG
jgi:metalloendopeptidase OMA1, mitochondrial